MDAAAGIARPESSDRHLLLRRLRRRDDITDGARAGGQYRYYTCSTKARMGSTGCKGMAVPMDKLDEAVIAHLEDRLLEPQRLERLMEQLLDRWQEWADQRRAHVTELRKRTTEAESKLNRLYDAIENGMLTPSDGSLKDRVDELTRIRDQARIDAERIISLIERVAPTIAADSLHRFATVPRRKLRDRECGYRRDHIRALNSARGGRQQDGSTHRRLADRSSAGFGV